MNQQRIKNRMPPLWLVSHAQESYDLKVGSDRVGNSLLYLKRTTFCSSTLTEFHCKIDGVANWTSIPKTHLLFKLSFHTQTMPPSVQIELPDPKHTTFCSVLTEFHCKFDRVANWNSIPRTCLLFNSHSISMWNRLHPPDNSTREGKKSHQAPHTLSSAERLYDIIQVQKDCRPSSSANKQSTWHSKINTAKFTTQRSFQTGSKMKEQKQQSIHCINKQCGNSFVSHLWLLP
jgi:hypothetical protein